jgi:hypothetical protein
MAAKEKNRTLAWLLAAGVLIGGLAILLMKLGNPPNMGVCVACFLRDTRRRPGARRRGNGTVPAA